MNLVDILFPKFCLGCRMKNYFLCPACLGKVRLVRQICVECEKPSVDGFTHIKCKRPWGLDGAVSIWEYEKVIRQSILKLKYNFAYEIADELAVYTVHYLKTNVHALPSNTILVPVPLYMRRERWRGFNQSERIGKIIAEKMGWNFSPEQVVRKSSTVPQVELRGKQRKMNLKDVFALNSSKKLNGASIVVFDDVMTTGTTLKEVGRVLKRGGAGEVWGLTLSR